MKNIFAIVVIISALVMLLNKRLAIFTSWKKINAKIIGSERMSTVTDRKKINYLYNIDGDDHEGYFVMDNDKPVMKEIYVYYHILNPGLSVISIPLNLEDYLLGLVAIVGGLYLYFFSCENCECDVEPRGMVIISKIKSIPVVSKTRQFD